MDARNAFSDTRYEKCWNPLRLEDVFSMIWITSLFTSTKLQGSGTDIYFELQVSTDVL